MDLSGEMLAVARRRAASLGLCAADGGGGDSGGISPVRFVRADATRLPFDGASFDTVLDTFSLCVLGAAAADALREAARVVRPGGCVRASPSLAGAPRRQRADASVCARRVLLLEHSRASFAPLGAYQDATSAVVAAAGKGCVWNQDVDALLAAVGLRAVAQTQALGGMLRSIEAVRAG